MEVAASPIGVYNLVVDLRSSDGVGGPFPKNRVAVGGLLATRSLQFSISNSTRQGVDELSINHLELIEKNWVDIFQNPVSEEIVLRLSGKIGDDVELALINLQRAVSTKS
ncbi:MAG: hypothetical protein R2822_15050 [Spirosomataceae bacterium]